LESSNVPKLNSYCNCNIERERKQEEEWKITKQFEEKKDRASKITTAGSQ